MLLTDFTYGVTDKIAVDFAVPLVMSKYTGARPHPGTDIDDGTYRTSFTDVRFAVRYNLARDSAVITPYVGSVVPSHNYAFYGHAAPGQQLNELQVGVYAAKLFERGLPGLFVSGRYGFGFVEKVLDISHNRSLGDLEVGYFFNVPVPRVHDGQRRVTRTAASTFPSQRACRHCRPSTGSITIRFSACTTSTWVAARPSRSPTRSTSFGSFSKLVAGRNGHALDRGITVGLELGVPAQKNAPSRDDLGGRDRLRRATLPTPRPRNAKARCSGASVRSHERRERRRSATTATAVDLAG